MPPVQSEWNGGRQRGGGAGVASGWHVGGQDADGLHNRDSPDLSTAAAHLWKCVAAELVQLNLLAAR